MPDGIAYAGIQLEGCVLHFRRQCCKPAAECLAGVVAGYAFRGQHVENELLQQVFAELITDGELKPCKAHPAHYFLTWKGEKIVTASG